jgi:hypothetical protein
MTDPRINDPAYALEIAKQDLDDIRLLNENKEFKRYFLRRIREKKEAFETTFNESDDISHEEREIQRRIIKEYRLLLEMMKADFETNKAAVMRAGKSPAAYGQIGMG